MKAITLAAAGVVGLLAIVAAVPIGQMGLVAANSEAKAEPVADATGKLHVPNNYRTTYQFLGTWAVAKDEGPGSEELHVVYASPGTIDAYRKDGHFPDGAVLVKEVYRAATEEMTTGTVSHADNLRGWFVMVRDRNGHHAENDVWGDGWGWSWFDTTDPATASRMLPVKDGVAQPTFDYRDNCKTCHAPAEGSEWIYVEGYAPLKR